MLINPKPKIYHFHSSQQQSQKMRKILLYIILGILPIVGIFIWQNKLTQIQKKSDQQISQAQEEFYQGFRKSLEDSGKNSFDLVVLGRKMLDKNLLDAGLASFQTATNKDQNYRDAFFYLGYAHLKITEELKNKETKKQYNNKTIEQYNNALEALLKARDLDPLYAPTYEFLAYTYNKLGDEENDRLCYNKFKELGDEKN